MKIRAKNENLFLVAIMLLNIVVGVGISLVPFFVPTEQLILYITLLVGEVSDPLAIFSVFTVGLAAWRIAILFKFSKHNDIQSLVKWPLIVFSPFNFALPLIVIYMIFKTLRSAPILVHKKNTEVQKRNPETEWSNLDGLINLDALDTEEGK